MNKGRGWMIVGTVMILCAAGLLLKNVLSAQNAAEATEDAMMTLVQRVYAVAEIPEKLPEETAENHIPAWMRDPFLPMPETEIDGVPYVGYLEIPSLELRLPVISEWDYDRLQISPCRYSGSVYLDNMVIAAHNYPSHFGRLKELVPGEELYFTDVDGNVFAFTVSASEVLPPTAVEDVVAGEWPLTLFTCTVGGAARVVVRCSAKQ